MVSKSYLPASAAGKGMTVVSGVVAAAACLTPAGIVCLFSPFCVCVPTQPGVSNPRSGPHGRRDAADWSQRVFSALPGIRLHHHASRWHVSETLCTQASVSRHAGPHSNPSALLNTDLHVQINMGTLPLLAWP